MQPNPFASPTSAESNSHLLILRNERSELSAVIHRYLNEEITAFEFDDELLPFYRSSDAAVRFVATELWFHYDDFKDHPVVLSRAGWGFFHRLLLLLDSDATVETARLYRWRWTQLVAIAAFVGLIAVVMFTGWGDHLWIYAIPFGLVSFMLALKATQVDTTQPYRSVLYPFTAFADLGTAYDQVGFKKPRYPHQLKGRTIRPPESHLRCHVEFFLGSLFWAPFLLLFQACPQLHVDSKVVFKGQNSIS